MVTICGIAGFSLKDDRYTDLDVPTLARALLLGIEERGRDATGAAWFGRNDGIQVQKAPVPAGRFIGKLSLGRTTRTAILHTRLATTGAPERNFNNHPITAPGVAGHRVIGTHNGWVNNVGALTKEHKLARHAEVDSEVIFSFLYAKGDDFKTLGYDLYGTYACAWVREDEPGRLYLMRGSSSPLILLENEYGVFYASTDTALDRLAKYLGEPKLGYIEVAEGRALVVENGEIGDVQSFQPNYYYYSTRAFQEDDEKWTAQHTTGTTTTVYTTPQVAYTNNKDNRRSFLGTAASDLARYLGLKKKTDSFSGEYGMFIWSGDRCIDFKPWKAERDVEEAVIEELLMLSTDEKLPSLIEQNLWELMDQVYGEDPTRDYKGKSTELATKYGGVEGVTADGERWFVWGGVVYIKQENGAYNSTGLSYEEFMDGAKFDDNVVDDNVAEAIIAKTLADTKN